MLRIFAVFAVFLAAKGNVIPNFTPFLLSNAMVCREDFIVQKYSLAKSNSCNNRQRTLVHTCSSQIYDPQFIHIPISGFICTIKTRTITTHKYFWGEEFLQKSDYSFAPLTPKECSQMVLLKSSEQEGPLTLVSDGFWQTKNTVDPHYQWLTTLEFHEKNAFLQTTTLFYNILTKTIISDVTETHGCKIEDNFCNTQDSTIV